MKTKGCHCEARSAVAISVGLWRSASFPLTPVCRDCFAEFTLVSRSSERSEEEILRYAQNDRKSEVLPQNDRGRRARNDSMGLPRLLRRFAPRNDRLRFRA
jgi:hypothetical protein